MRGSTKHWSTVKLTFSPGAANAIFACPVTKLSYQVLARVVSSLAATIKRMQWRLGAENGWMRYQSYDVGFVNKLVGTESSRVVGSIRG